MENKIVSLEYYEKHKDELKGIPLTITLDGKPPKEIDETELEEIRPQPQEPTLEQRLEALEMMEIERLLHG